MRGLAGLAWRSLTARPLRTGLTVTGVALGVAVLFAGLAMNAGIAASAERTVADLVGRADLRVESFGETGLGPETVAAIATTPGVAVAAPALERRTYLGAASTGGGLPLAVTVLGIDPALDPAVRDLTLVAGSPLALTADTQTVPGALVTERLAESEHLVVGSPLAILGAGAPTRYVVAGIVAGNGPLGGAFGRTVIVPLASAQAAFDEVGVTRVDLVVAPGADPAAVTAAFEAALLTEPYVVSSPQDLADSLQASTVGFAATTALIAAIALFAGAFLIFNTLSMTVHERVREVGLLRAAGATRGQVRRFILAQATVIGAAGSVVGIVLGALLANVMVASLRTVGDVALESPPFPVEGAALAFAVGLIVTIAAALEPADRAARISPVEALRSRLDLPSARRARLRWLVVVFLVVAAVGLVIWPAGSGVAVRSLVVYGILLAMTLAIPWLVPMLARFGGLPFRLPLRLEERLARATLIRDRSRATLTLGALAIGLALVVALGGVGAHARASAGAWVADVVPGDVLVTSIRPIAAEEGIAGDLAAVPGVWSVSPIASFHVAVRGIATDAAAMTGADLAADGRLTIVGGDRTDALAALDAGGGTIVPQALADRLRLALGSTVELTAIDGEALSLEVVGIAERTLPGRGGEAMLVGWADATERLGVAGADAYAVRFEPDGATAARDRLASAASLSALEVVPLEQVQGAIDDALVRVFGLFDALALIAVTVAALGIANTLTMNVVERVREIGILRAAGMTRRQVWRSVVVEAGVIGVAGAFLGIVAGLLVGAAMVVLAGGQPALAASVSWPVVGLALVLGVTLSMLAAAYPARLAARVSIVRAVAYE